MEHLPKSNNSLTVKWNIADGNNRSNIKEFQAKVSLPKTEGRICVLKGLPHQTTKNGVKQFLLRHHIQTKNIRTKGRTEGMDNEENFNGKDGQFTEWIIRTEYSMKHARVDLGTYENEWGKQKTIFMSPLPNATEQSAEPVQVTYPAASLSYKKKS
jgi:hypothetical protein